jgi:hypothetical protein
MMGAPAASLSLTLVSRSVAGDGLQHSTATVAQYTKTRFRRLRSTT